MSQYPRRRPGFQVKVVDDELVVLDLPGHQVHHLNTSARYLWESCDGARAEDEIERGFAVAFGIDQATAREDVARTLALFESLGLLEPRGRER